MRLSVIATAITCFSLATAPTSAATVIHAGRLIDGQSDTPRSEVTIVVKEGRITNISAGYSQPQQGDQLIRLTEHTVMPGLMDMHTHLMSQHSKDSYTER